MLVQVMATLVMITYDFGKGSWNTNNATRYVAFNREVTNCICHALYQYLPSVTIIGHVTMQLSLILTVPHQWIPVSMLIMKS